MSSKRREAVPADTLLAGTREAFPEVRILNIEQIEGLESWHHRVILSGNTVVSGAMKLLNALEDFKSDGSVDSAEGDHAALAEGYSILLRVLYPATPHISHTLWQDLGFAKLQGDLLDAPWPTVDEAALKQDEIELMLQINGKLRGSITVPAGATKEAIEKMALGNEAFIKYAEGAAPKKVIIVPGRLVNVVV